MAPTIRPKKQMRAAMLLLVVLLAVSSPTAVEGRMEQHSIKRRGMLGHGKRQVLGGPGDVGTNQQGSAGASQGPAAPVAASNAAAPSVAQQEPATSAQAATTPSSAANPLNPLTGLFPVSNASPTSADDDDTSAPANALSIAPTISSLLNGQLTNTASSSLATSRTTSSNRQNDEEESVDVINVTSTALIAASLSSASAAAASASTSEKPKEEESSGMSKISLIAIIAIGSSVALIAAVWTIFRKWKLSPSRQFEDKLTPIDWSPEMAGAHRSEDKLVLTRSNSTGSGVSSMHKSPSAVGGQGMRRQNSWGSANGSQMNGYGSRSDMAEVPYQHSAVPAYPPANGYGYADQYNQQPARAASPYEHLQRQPTGFSATGGRYGEGYGRPNY